MANSASFPVLCGDSFGLVSVAFGTVINRLLPARKGAYTRLQKLVYTAGGTAHTITLMRSLGRTTTTADAAASQAVINIAANPGPTGNSLAGSDYVAYRTDAGLFVLDTVASISSLAVTLTTSLAVALSAGADLWMFGVAADTDPLTGSAHGSLRGVANATTSYFEDLIGLCCSHNPDEPILIQSNNATATGYIDQATYAHTPYGRK